MFEPMIRFKERLKAGELLLGPGINLSDPRVSEALADSVDFLWIDLEHSVIGAQALYGHLMAARGRDTAAIVRVTGSDAAFIKPVLDTGAHGIVVPQVRSVEEVRQVIADCRYTPEGQRGFGPLVPSNYGRTGLPEYVEEANAGVFVAVMIENVEALEAIDEIVALPGLDSVVLGPMDLSASLDLLGQVDDPQVVEAMERVIRSARAAGVGVGSGLGANTDFALAQVRRGVQWLQVGGDCEYLVQGMDRITSTIREKVES